MKREFKDLIRFEQYKAVLPLLGYYQFIDKFFTPGYLLSVIAERK